MKTLKELSQKVADALKTLKISEKQTRLAEIEAQMAKPDFWNEQEKAEKTVTELSALKKITEPWLALNQKLQDLTELDLLLGDNASPEEKQELEHDLEAVVKEYTVLRKQLLYTGEYDSGNAILRITAGVGGTEAMDFAAMLERMYLRWAEQNGFKPTQIERLAGDEAGIKTSVLEIAGPYAYGQLKSDHGTHRLVRLSPFNADNLRQTSFALVEVLPIIEQAETVIDPKDLRIDIYRSGGHGGQSVNTTDSAVRITHLPTNTVVAIQNERSQLKNKELAFKILAAKLEQLRQEQHAESLNNLRAGKSADWGSQIRNYVLHPYTLVKDTRTKYEETDAGRVLDGHISGFSDAYLEWLASQNNQN
ncbi:MAG: peptide chain release factor 2 [Candidatus Nomurabacteria bacterium]|jgi:peptide chain release factor 2|nr:peptide chain release factor 2 [Candidatus Nomurabacteria bacterium]